MDAKSNSRKGFENRFSIEVGIDDAKKRFVNRLFNLIDSEFLGFTTMQCNLEEYVRAFKCVAFKLGERYNGVNTLECYSGKEFAKVLKTVEALYQSFDEELNDYANSATKLDEIIKTALAESEVDLGVQWREGLFYPSGAKLLDEALVSEPLKWLADPKFNNVSFPFRKALTHYLEAGRKPEKLIDTIRDMYEALESLAKLVTGSQNKDLSANAESFVSKIKLNTYYSKMLKEYIGYANEYRHGVEEGKTRLVPKPSEVEAFLYITGLFIRLALKQLDAVKLS